MGRVRRDPDGRRFDALLEQGAPWAVRALCTECGEEHVTLTWDPRRRDPGRELERLGVCRGCADAEAERLKKLTAPRVVEQPKVPTLEEVRERAEVREGQSDAFDPWNPGASHD